MTNNTTPIPDGWTETTLGEVCEKIGDGLHGTPIYSVNGEYYFVNGNNIKDGKLIIKADTKKVNEQQLQKHKKDIGKNTILLSINGTIGNLAKYNNEKCILGKSAAYLNIKDTISKDYIYYLMLDHKFQYDISRNANGSTIKNVSLAQLRNYQFFIPPLPQQKQIASILSSLDDKIELLREQNKTLEATAQTIFHEWFGKYSVSKPEELPEGWRVHSLSEYVKTVNGYSYKGKELVESSEKALVTLKSFNRHGGFQTRGFKSFKGSPKESQEVQIGDLIVAHTDLTQDADVLGNPAIIFDNAGFSKMYITMDLVKVEPSQDWMTKSFLYYLMKTRYFKHHCVGYSNGTTVLHLSKKAIINYEIVLPNDKDLVIKFSKIADKTTSKIAMNVKQIQTLSKTRDIILPKLMSGKITARR